MKTKHLCGTVLFAALLATGCSTEKVEKTVVQREPARVVVEHRAPDTTVTREQITEQRTDEFGNPIEQRRRVTTEYVR
ncbi:MAG: hypothetical protein U0136_19560 [Bdellovibrionota bacterium]